MREGRNGGGELSAHLLRLTHALYRVTDRMPREEPLRHGIREKAGKIFSLGVAVAHGRGNNGEADDVWIAIEILLGYLSMARVLGCIDPMNFLVLEREYTSLVEQFAVIDKSDIIKQGVGQEAHRRQQEAELEHADHNKGIQENNTIAQAGAARPPVGETKKVSSVRDNHDFSRDAVPLKAERISNRVNERQKKIMERLAGNGRVKISDFYGTFDGISSKTIQRDLQDLTMRNIIKKEGEKRWTIYSMSESVE